jgi:hypothetical protein
MGVGKSEKTGWRDYLRLLLFVLLFSRKGCASALLWRSMDIRPMGDVVQIEAFKASDLSVHLCKFPDHVGLLARSLLTLT